MDIQAKIKGRGKSIPNNNKKNLSSKINTVKAKFKGERLSSNKAGPYLMIKRIIYQIAVIILNLYALIRVSKYIKQHFYKRSTIIQDFS